jgi:hypothetical protein
MKHSSHATSPLKIRGLENHTWCGIAVGLHTRIYRPPIAHIINKLSVTGFIKWNTETYQQTRSENFD